MADKVLHIDSSGEQYAKLLPPISGDLDDLVEADPDSEPFALAVYQAVDAKPYWEDDYCEDGYVEVGVGGAWRKMDFATLKYWLEYTVVSEPYMEPDYVHPDYVD